MENFATNWVGIAALVTALVVAGVLIYLYKKGQMKSGDLTNIAGLIDKVADVLEGVGKGDTVVATFAEYAAKAVRVVEQLVKNGELEKDNELRKNEAKAIVEQLAFADDVDLEIVHENEDVIDSLIEAAVYEMQSTGVRIEFGSEEYVESSQESE